MKILVLIIIVVMIVLLLFKKYFDSREKLTRFINEYSVMTRLAYIGFALLWLFANKNDIFLSEWDAVRLGVPVSWYVIVPAFSLFSYAVYPLFSVWLFPVAALLVGWSLHSYKSLAYLLSKTEGYSEIETWILFVLFDILLLVICLSVLYITGPYLRRRTRSNEQG
jgi:hypothetical protein